MQTAAKLLEDIAIEDKLANKKSIEWTRYLDAKHSQKKIKDVGLQTAFHKYSSP